MSIKGRFGSTLAVLALSAGGLVTTALPAHAGTVLGGINVARYCAKNVKSGTLAASPATNINDSWDGWRCGTRYGLVEVDMNLACRQQYPRSWWWQKYAYATSGNGMYTWVCNRA